MEDPVGEATVDLMRALNFAARKHAGQVRKGVVALPYINHLAEVADLLARATGGRDPVLLIGGLLHDTLEDTDTTRDELTSAFGAEVAALVAEVSDDTSLPKAERKRAQIKTAGAKSARARMLKLADKTSNVRAVADNPPAGWDLERRLEYIDWARDVAAGCRGVNAKLEAWFDEAYAAATARTRESGA